LVGNADESSGLDWSTRYKIIEGICYGLRHLHEENGKPIIHLDLKPANILLDDGMVPKITDFGLSRLLDQQQTICTTSRDGTL
jgi:serine/threonine protein kinase